MPLSRISLSLYLGQQSPSKASPVLLQALQSTEIRQADDSGDDYRQGFQLTFNARRKNSAAPDYELLTIPDLKPGNRIVMAVTLDGKPHALMDGIITHHQLGFEAGGSDPRLVVMGKDLSVLMDLTEKREGYSGMKLKEVVEKILSDYSKHGIEGKVTAPATEWPTEPAEHVPFQTGTDLQYLRALAEANGYLFNIQAGPQAKKSIAYWGPPDRSAAAQPALTINMGNNDTVDKIDFAYDALRPTRTKRVKSGDQPTLDEVLKSKISPELAKKVALTGNGDFVRQRWLTYAGPDDGEASARAQGMVDLTNETVVKATGRLDVLKYGHVLAAPGLVGLRGVGMTYDGEYYVKAVKHLISQGSYTQEFTLTREGVTSAKPKVKV
ncbi:MAG: hypothetical protein PVF74_00130 [Anaerolineales bacterium]|jgi:phage protein D